MREWNGGVSEHQLRSKAWHCTAAIRQRSSWQHPKDQTAGVETGAASPQRRKRKLGNADCREIQFGRGATRANHTSAQRSGDHSTASPCLHTMQVPVSRPTIISPPYSERNALRNTNETAQQKRYAKQGSPKWQHSDINAQTGRESRRDRR